MNNINKNPRYVVEPELRVAFILQPAFTLLAFSGFMDVLRCSADESDLSRQILCKWWVVGDPAATVKASSGTEIHQEISYDELDPARLDYVVVVGGLLSEAETIDPDAYRFLHAAREAGTCIVALCTGFFHLARAGLLSGKRCCVHWVDERRLENEYPDVIPVLGQAYVEDDGIFTALGGIAGLELAIDLVERHCGRRRSRKCIDRLCVDSSFASYRHPNSVEHEFEVTGDRFLERAVEAMRHTITGDTTIKQLAHNVGISSRQLRNIFRKHTGKSPARFWREIRLHEAKWRLSETSQSITQIAYAAGFADSAHLSRSFRALFGTTPRVYRQTRLTADSPADKVS